MFADFKDDTNGDSNFEMVSFIRSMCHFDANTDRCVVMGPRGDSYPITSKTIKLTSDCYSIPKSEYDKHPQLFGRAVYEFHVKGSPKNVVYLHPEKIIIKRTPSDRHENYSLKPCENLKSICVDNDYKFTEVNFTLVFDIS